jgi:NAD(P)-dependent dehydrogenase (short-subunit alcohol dehydrogenase family)
MVPDTEFLEKKTENFELKRSPLEFETPQIWAKLFETNTYAPFFVTRVFVGLLTKGAESRNSTACVINTSSIAAEFKPFVEGLSVRTFQTFILGARANIESSWRTARRKLHSTRFP